MEGRVDRAASSALVPAAAVERRNPGNIHGAVAPKAHLVGHRADLVREDRDFDALGQHHLAYNAVHVLPRDLVKLHRPAVDPRDDTGFVPNQHALEECTAEDLILQIRLLVKDVVDERCLVKTARKQIACHRHRVRRGVRILEDACVRNDTDVECAGDRFVDHGAVDRVDEVVNELAGAGGLRTDVVRVAAPRIALVMVDVKLLFRRVKIILRAAEPVRRRIHCNENVIF